jgi:hypothetical protein
MKLQNNYTKLVPHGSISTQPPTYLLTSVLKNPTLQINILPRLLDHTNPNLTSHLSQLTFNNGTYTEYKQHIKHLSGRWW